MTPPSTTPYTAPSTTLPTSMVKTLPTTKYSLIQGEFWSFKFDYRKVASSNTSRLEEHAGFFRL